MPYSLENWTNRIATRSDLTGYLTHLTRPANINSEEVDSIEVLIKILSEQCLIGSSTQSGFICGNRKAVCFQDTPIHQLTQNIYSEQEYRKNNPQARLRYTGTGLMFQKPYLYRKNGRPVIYDKAEIAKSYLPIHEWWRIVKLELSDDENIIDWTHEREWRVPDNLNFELKEVIVILANTNSYKKFISKCREVSTFDILKEIKGIITLSPLLF